MANPPCAQRLIDGVARKIVDDFFARFEAVHLHGACARVPPGDTAFAARRPQWDFDAIGQWTDAAESARHIEWVRNLWRELEPHLQGSAYVNHLSQDDRPEKVRASFGASYGRLREIKRVYDPTNLFRLNANIAP